MLDKQPTYSGLELVAGELRSARTQRNLTLDEVSRILMIQKKYLENIETGDLRFLPRAYIYNYVRKYAGEMGIADDDMFARCRRELLLETCYKKKRRYLGSDEKNGQNESTAKGSPKKSGFFFIFIAAITAITFFFLTASF